MVGIWTLPPEADPPLAENPQIEICFMSIFLK